MIAMAVFGSVAIVCLTALRAYVLHLRTRASESEITSLKADLFTVQQDVRQLRNASVLGKRGQA